MWYWCAGYPFTGSLVTYTPRSFPASVVDSGVFPMWYWCAGYPFTGSLVTYTPRSFSASVVDSGVFPMWYWCAGYPFTGNLVTYTPRSFSASVVDSGVFPMWYWYAGYPFTGSLVTYTPRSFSASVVDSGVFPMWYWCAGYPLPRCRTLHFSSLNCSSHFLFHSCILVRSSGRKSAVKGLISTDVFVIINASSILGGLYHGKNLARRWYTVKPQVWPVAAAGFMTNRKRVGDGTALRDTTVDRFRGRTVTFPSFFLPSLPTFLPLPPFSLPRSFPPFSIPSFFSLHLSSLPLPLLPFFSSILPPFPSLLSLPPFPLPFPPSSTTGPHTALHTQGGVSPMTHTG
ncbi:uncharacterized protein LOC126984749 isoform X9 [Eriocheir sinensis]|nr:uncharacterized protein LOC126984749 isoform X9 [Eriocheir sinensis]